MSSANIQASRAVFMPYIGGFPAYIERCEAVVKNGLRGLSPRLMVIAGRRRARLNPKPLRRRCAGSAHTPDNTTRSRFLIEGLMHWREPAFRSPVAKRRPLI